MKQLSLLLNFENGNGKNTTNIWPEHGYFKQQPCDFGLDQESFPENSLIYINPGYLTIKDNRKHFYAGYYLIAQIDECANPPRCGRHRELLLYRKGSKAHRPRYDVVTGNFLGLCESLGIHRT